MNIDQAARKSRKEKGHLGLSLSRNTIKNMGDALSEAQGIVGKRTETDQNAANAKAAIVQNRKNITVEYALIYKKLKRSDTPGDKELAKQLGAFMDKMPDVKTRHEQLVELVVREQNQKNEQKINRREPKPDQPKRTGPKIS